MVSNDDINMVVEPQKVQPISEINYYGDYHYFTFTVPVGYRWRIRNIHMWRQASGDMEFSLSDGYFTMLIKELSSTNNITYEPMTPWWLPSGSIIIGRCLTSGTNGNENIYLLYEQDTEY